MFYCTGLSGLCVVTHDRFLSPFIENSLILFHNWIVDTYRPGVEVHRWKLNLSHSVHELWKQYLSEHTSALCMYGASDWIFGSTYNSQRTLLHSTTFHLYPIQLCVCVCVRAAVPQLHEFIRLWDSYRVKGQRQFRHVLWHCSDSRSTTEFKGALCNKGSVDRNVI